MLQALREKSSGWIATIILGLLMIPFAFFGMEQYLFQRTETYAAKIEAPPTWWPSAPDWWLVRKLVWQKDEISVDQFKSAFERARQSEREAAGENFDPRRFETIERKLEVLEVLIDQRVMKLSTDQAGLVVGDAELAEALRTQPAFQVDGQFNAQRYRLLLASSRPPLTPKQYDEQLREELQQTLLPERLRASSFVTSAEGKRLIGLYGEQRDVSYIALPAPAADTTPLTPAEIAEWYKTHQNEYRAPEQVTLEYIEIDGNALPVPAAPTEQALRERYEQEKARFVEPDQRLTSHILVKLDAAADAAAQKAAQAKAEKLLAQARAPGADFAALARANSEDEGSKDSGGDLGWVQKGAMVKAFEDAVFAMNSGEIRGPVKSEFGYHIIQVREIKNGRAVPFEDARPQLEQLVAETARERAYNDITGVATDKAIENPTSLKSVADAVKLPVQRVGPFSRGQGGSGIAANPQVQRRAFSDDLKQDRTVSNPIEIGENRSVLIRVVDYSPERVQPLAQVGAQVAAAIRADRARKAAEAEADALLARMKAGETLEAVAASRQLTVTAVPAVQRGAPVPDQQANRAYFEAAVPAAGKASYGRVQAQDGSFLVFAVTKVDTEAGEKVPVETRVAFLGSVAPRAGEQEARALVQAQRKRMKIDRAEDRL